MKFGKNLPRNQVPEWSSNYINYKGLKKQIKAAVIEKRAGNEPDLAPFFFALDRNIENVDSFFNKRLAEAQRRLKLLRGRYEDHFDLTNLSESSSVNGSVKSEDFDNENVSKTPEGYGLDRDEIAEILGALLELRSGLRKLQWYGEVNRRGFIKILKKYDLLEKGSNSQRRYLESKVIPKSFASATEALSTMHAVNSWLSKVGGNEGFDPEGSRSLEIQSHPVLRRVSSGAAAGISSELIRKIDECVREDKASTLSEILLKTTEKEYITQKLILNLLQRVITSRALSCIGVLLSQANSLHELDDINGRNVIHRLVIAIGRTKASGSAPPSLQAVHPQLYITPAESPISTPPAGNTVECDGTLRLSPDDESVKLLEYLLTKLRVDQRSALAERDSYGRLPLHYAAQYGFVVICRLIIKFMREWGQFDVSDGIDSTNWQDADGYAPLHLAVIGEHPKTTRTLLQAENWDGGVGTSDKVVSARKTVSKSSAVLIMATKRNCFGIVKLLVEAGVDINYQDENGETALHHAARLGHVDCVKTLLNGSDSQRPDIELVENTYGWTPLFIAAVEGKYDVAEALIDIGECEIDKVDFSGWSAPEHATLRGHLKLAKLLIAKNLTVRESVSIITGSPPLSSSMEKNVSNISLSGSLGPTGSTLPSNTQPQTVKSFGHRYLKKDKTMVLITLGSMDVRKNLQAVKLDQIPVSEAHTTQLDTALSLVVSAQNADGEPTIVDLPVHANVATDDPIAFETQDASKVKILFDIVPTYAGSNDRIVGRAVAILDALKTEIGVNRTSLRGAIQVPILSIGTLEIIGSVNFEFCIVTPFDHPNIGITKEHTYWKSLTSPRVIGHRGLGKNFPSRKSLQLGENTLLSFIAAANLGASYVEVYVQLTKDHVPVIYHDFLVGETGIDAPVHTLTLEQFLSMKQEFPPQEQRTGSPDRFWGSDKAGSTPSNDQDNGRTPPLGLRKIRSMSLHESDGRHQSDMEHRMKHTRAFKKNGFKGNSRGTSIQAPFPTLEQTFKELPAHIGFNIELKYPMLQETQDEEMDNTVIEMNAWVDAVLKVVYDHGTGSGRNIIFSSFNPDICLMLSFKQPSIPILFLTESGTRALSDIRASSLQEAIRFASRWNLLGIVSAVEPLVLCPRLIKVVKETGLVCVTYGVMNNEAENVKLQVEQGVDALIVDRVLAIDKALRPSGDDEKADPLKVSQQIHEEVDVSIGRNTSMVGNV
ncbi:glycerophosphocholine phosphodiesterase-like protein Gde1 [Geopyxis carbonaria]|nr:glycerophosphocholine phosphodiesterase-like protein Gde1 [Geopyxis carbonaria]